MCPIFPDNLHSYPSQYDVTKTSIAYHFYRLDRIILKQQLLALRILLKSDINLYQVR